MRKKTSGRWCIPALAASAVSVSGCAVDPDELPGTYRNAETGGEILLNSDGTFAATDISADDTTGTGSGGPVDFSGSWEFVDSDSSNFIYLTIDNDGLGTIAGVQLYTSGSESVEFQPALDEPPSLKLTKVTES